MQINESVKGGFQIRPEKDEYVSIKLGSDRQSSIETVGKKGAYTVLGRFAAISMKTILRSSECMGDYIEYDVKLCCYDRSGFSIPRSFGPVNSVHFDSYNIYRARFLIRGSHDILDVQDQLQSYLRTMNFSRALEMSQVISSRKKYNTKILHETDVELLRYLNVIPMQATK